MFGRHIIAVQRQFLSSFDVFISYARLDAADYAKAMADSLTSGEFKLSCTFDHWETRPNAQDDQSKARVPQGVLKSARYARALVVVGSPASLSSDAMDEEVTEFLKVPGPVILIGFPGIDITNAVWYSRVAGVAVALEPGGLLALQSGTPAVPILQRTKSALGYWTRNARIRAAARIGLCVFAIATIGTGAAMWKTNVEIKRANRAGLEAGAAMKRKSDADALAAKARAQAEEALRLADAAGRQAAAASMAITGQDILQNSPNDSLRALHLGIESMQKARTSWGEFVLRKSMALTPQLVGRLGQPAPLRESPIVSKAFPDQVAYGPNGAFARWSYERKDREVATTFEFLNSWHLRSKVPTIAMSGFISDVKFNHNQKMAIIQVTDRSSMNNIRLEIVGWQDPALRRLPVEDIGSFAISPRDDSIAIARKGSVEVWSVGLSPSMITRWSLPAVWAIAYSADGKSIYAASKDVVYALAGNNIANRVINFDEPTEYPKVLIATPNHVVINTKSGLRSFNLATEKWDHSDLGYGSPIALVHERILVKRQSEVALYDLAQDGVDYYANTVVLKCPQENEQDVLIRSVSASADGEVVTYGCATGLAVVVRAQGGSRIAMAPLSDTDPVALWLDENGHTLNSYAIRDHLSPNPVRAEATEWRILNSCPASLGSLQGNLALGSNGSTVLRLSDDGATFYDIPSGLVRASVRLPVGRMGFFKVISISNDGRKAAIGDWNSEHISIIHAESESPTNHLITPDIYGSVVAAAFGGPSETTAAIVEKRRDNRSLIHVGTIHRDRWVPVVQYETGSWVRHVLPDDIILSPLAISGAGSIAYLAPCPENSKRDEPQSYKTVRVVTVKGLSEEVSLPSAVSALEFQTDEELVIGTRSGDVYVWKLEQPLEKATLIGRQTGMVLRLLKGPQDSVLAVDSENVVRMWKTKTRFDETGVRGFMETPLALYGISNYSGVGIQSMGIRANYLYVINRGAGLQDYISCWFVPMSDKLLQTAKSIDR